MVQLGVRHHLAFLANYINRALRIITCYVSLHKQLKELIDQGLMVGKADGWGFLGQSFRGNITA